MEKEKDLRKSLELAASDFKFEGPEIKKKGRTLYQVALKAIERCEMLRAQLDAYKAPVLFDKNEPPDAESKKEKVFSSKAERIKWFLENDPENTAFHIFLRFNRLTLDDAKKLMDTRVK